MTEHTKLTKLQRFPRAVVRGTLIVVCIPLFVVLVPLAIAWELAKDVGENVCQWMNRKYWN